MKNKYIKNTLITIVIFGLLILFEYYVKGNVIAQDIGDYINQHTMFIDYIRQNFWASGDFFPQWSMNYGLGQSFAIMLYHGLYNPFITLTYIVPWLNPVFAFELIFTIILGLNTLAMTKLLELNKIEGRLNSIISVLSSFSGVFLYQMATQTMFLYYLPIMVLSLVSLHYLVDNQRKSYYAVTVGLIFYTNFTFAPIISVLQFLYYTALLVEANKLNFKSYLEFFKAYIIGVLSGMMILIPTGVFMLHNPGRTETLSLHINTFMSYGSIVQAIGSRSYCSGIFIVGIFALLGTILITRRKKYLIILIPMILILILKPLNFAFNLFQYINLKVYIMYIPLWWLMFAETIKRGNKVNLGILTLVSTVLYIIPTISDMTILNMGLILLGAGLIYCLIFTKNKILSIIFCLLLIILNINKYMIFSPSAELTDFTNARGEDAQGLIPYRELNEKDNYIENIYSQVPNAYTSLESDSYSQATRTEYENPIWGYDRHTHSDAFDNIYTQNLYAIKNQNVDVNPIVYGVNQSDVYSLDTYQKLDKDQKLYAVNQGVFIEDAKNINYKNQFGIEPVYSTDKSVTVKDSQDFDIEIPKQYQNGVLNISFDDNVGDVSSKVQSVNINGQINDAIYKDQYGINDNRHMTFRIPTNDVSKLDVKVKIFQHQPVVYSNLKITYQSLDDFEQKKIKVIEPTQFSADLNNSYSFDLNMETPGYLATTIPYDKGFKVFVDEEEVQITKLEDLFIGAKLTAGQHHIVIEYHIPGFRLGLILTTGAWLMIGYIFIMERLQAKQ